jgi:hypothetical protein
MSQFEIDLKEVLADAEPEPVEEPVEVLKTESFAKPVAEYKLWPNLLSNLHLRISSQNLLSPILI